MEQGQAGWPEGAVQAERDLGDPHLQLFRRARELALFDLGIDSKLRACDLVRLKVRDICHGDRVAARAIVMQQKTNRPVQFEITESTREAVAAWIKEAGMRSEDYLPKPPP